jgi:branched-subunit amino acid transport protein
MIWLTIVVSGLITFVLRFFAIFQVKNSNIPQWLENILKYVPTAVLSTLIFPEVLFNDSNSIQLIENPKILAASSALLVTILTKNVIITIITGMLVLWILTLN